jgi:hypothetical protein
MVNVNQLGASVQGVACVDNRVALVRVQVKGAAGELLGSAIPTVTFVKTGRYQPKGVPPTELPELEILGRIERNLNAAPLAGFVAEGAAPFGGVSPAQEDALLKAVCSGMPVVKVGRGNAEGMVPRNPPYLYVSGMNLTANKARLLLMASLMKLGALPPAANPDAPTQDELAAIKAKLDEYQAIFDRH